MSNGERVDQSQNTQTRAPAFLDSALRGATSAATGAFGGQEDPNTVAGRNLIGQSLRGDFLDPSSNPFLQQTFDRGADAIQKRLDTQFSGAGRNIGASIPAAKADLSGFANDLFGGNFQRERDRQIQSMFGAQAFNPLDMLIRRLQGIAPAAGQDTQSSSQTEQHASPLDRALGFGSMFLQPIMMGGLPGGFGG